MHHCLWSVGYDMQTQLLIHGYGKLSYHIFKNEEQFIVFPDNILQLYDIGMIQFSKCLEKKKS